MLDLSGPLQSTVLVAPEHKLLWCRVGKVASSTAAAVVTRLRALHPGSSKDLKAFFLNGTISDRMKAAAPQSAATERKWRRAQPLWARAGVGSPVTSVRVKDVPSILADASWTKVLLWRDPVERFLSAYLSKCRQGHDPPGECVLATKEQPYISFDTFMSRARRGVDETPPHNTLFRNGHWRPQSRCCGGLTPDTGLPYYNAVHPFSADTVPAVVTSVLKQAGVELATIRHLQTSVLADPHHGFPADRMKNNKRHITAAASKLCQYFPTIELVEEVAAWYAEDYAAFAGRGMMDAPSYWLKICG